jgi:hypothetical protein
VQIKQVGAPRLEGGNVVELALRNELRLPQVVRVLPVKLDQRRLCFALHAINSARICSAARATCARITTNTWAAAASQWLIAKPIADQCKDAEKILKNAVPPDAKKCFGHGVRIIEDILLSRSESDTDFVELGPVARWVYDRQIPLELAVSSNMQTGAVQIDDATVSDHPFAVLYDLGFKVTVNTDNRLMSGTTLTKELELLVDTFDYTLADLETFQLNAAEAAFQDLEQREELMDMISEGFADFA